MVLSTCYYNREEQEQKEAYQQLRKTIDQHYRPLHKHLYQLRGWELVPSFREAVESGDETKMRSLLTEETPGISLLPNCSNKKCVATRTGIFT